MKNGMEAVREQVLARYGMDIKEAERYFSSFNYAFVFPNDPHGGRIRINLVIFCRFW